MSMSGIFIPIFLYHLDYQIWQIMAYYCIAFTAQYLFCLPSAKIVGKIGPKHTILISYFLQGLNMLGLIYLKSHADLFIFSAIMLGVGNIMFFMPYHIDFSKIKHKKTGGKELGIAYLGERIGAVAGPLIGGLIAFMFSPKYIFVATIGVLLLAVVPLLMTAEPTRLNQRLIYNDFDISKISRDTTSYGFFTIEVATSMIVWPLFLGVFVLIDNPYISLGAIMSVAIFVSVVITRLYGRLIDHGQGRILLRVTAVANALLHLARVTVSGFGGALAVNMANELVTPGYRLPIFKGMYTAADDYPGHRIVYISIMEMVSSGSRAIFFAVATLAAYYLGSGRSFFGVLFIIGATASIMIIYEKFHNLNQRTVHKND